MSYAADSVDAALFQVLPSDLEAEQAVLGSALVSQNAADRLGELLDEADFFLVTHRHIYQAVQHLRRQDPPGVPDPQTVESELRRRAQWLPSMEGYLIRLAEGVPTAQLIEHYAAPVRETGQLRRVIEACDWIKAQAMARQVPAPDLQALAESRLYAAAKAREAGAFVAIRTLAQEALERHSSERARERGISTGMPVLDRKLSGGWKRKRLTFLAARPGMGKTSGMCALALNAALQGHPVGVFSLEMSREELTDRWAASLGKIDAARMEGGCLTSADYEHLARVLGRVGDLPIHVNDRSEQSIADIRSHARQLSRQHGIRLFFVDYVQQIRALGRTESMHQHLAEVAEQLKAMAKELDASVIVLSQLSRQVERREDKRPMISDLRESGGLEAAADTVIMLYRADYYQQKELAPEGGGECEWIFAKNRFGSPGTARLMFDGRFHRFWDPMDEHGDEQAPPERHRYAHD